MSRNRSITCLSRGPFRSATAAKVSFSDALVVPIHDSIPISRPCRSFRNVRGDAARVISNRPHAAPSARQGRRAGNRMTPMRRPSVQAVNAACPSESIYGTSAPAVRRGSQNARVSRQAGEGLSRAGVPATPANRQTHPNTVARAEHICPDRVLPFIWLPPFWRVSNPFSLPANRSLQLSSMAQGREYFRSSVGDKHRL